jgi:hypothetical protein
MQKQLKIGASQKVNLATPDAELFEPGELGLTLEIQVRDRYGNVKQEWKKRSESFVRQFLDLLMCAFNSNGPYNPQYTADITNVQRPLIAHSQLFQNNGGIGDTYCGIVVGTDFTAPTITDYALITPITHGVGAGQLQYGAMAYGAPSANLTVSSFTNTRVFTNGSGVNITVYELGIYVNGYYNNGGIMSGVISPPSLARFMIVRDVIGAGILIQNGEALTVNYRYQGVV